MKGFKEDPIFLFSRQHRHNRILPELRSIPVCQTEKISEEYSSWFYMPTVLEGFFDIKSNTIIARSMQPLEEQDMYMYMLEYLN